MSPRAFSTTSLRPVSWACRRYGSIERTTEISERQPSPSPTWTGCRRHSTRSSQGWGESVGRSPANAMDVEAWSYPASVDTSGGERRLWILPHLERLVLDAVGGDVAERRVPAPRVVEALDELEDLEPRPIAALEGAPIDQLALDRREGRLGDRVVEGVAAATDRLDHARRPRASCRSRGSCTGCRDRNDG
jgi:hypothetical protein